MTRILRSAFAMASLAAALSVVVGCTSPPASASPTTLTASIGSLTMTSRGEGPIPSEIKAGDGINISVGWSVQGDSNAMVTVVVCMEQDNGTALCQGQADPNQFIPKPLTKSFMTGKDTSNPPVQRTYVRIYGFVLEGARTGSSATSVSQLVPNLATRSEPISLVVDVPATNP